MSDLLTVIIKLSTGYKFINNLIYILMLDCGFNDVYCMRNYTEITNIKPVINNNKLSNDYYHKYLKYKTKYLKLKNIL